MSILDDLKSEYSNPDRTSWTGVFAGNTHTLYASPITLNDRKLARRRATMNSDAVAEAEDVLAAMLVIKAEDADGNRIFTGSSDRKFLTDRVPSEVIDDICTGLFNGQIMNEPSDEDVEKN